MRIPYVVGRWVRGKSHYGRQRLIDYLLATSDSATWLVGTRRMGKTSLLRQLEYVAAADSPFVPLFWDLQGCRTSGEMAAELAYALEEAQTRFEIRGIDVRTGRGRGCRRTCSAHSDVKPPRWISVRSC